jgi:hypothetical protein
MTVLPDQDARLRAMHAATRLVQRLRNRPRKVVTPHDYADLHERLLAYVQERFGACLEDGNCCRTVQRGIEVYLAPYYVAGTPRNQMDPEDLFKHIDDAGLEEFKPCEISTVATGMSDDELVKETFGAHADSAGFRAALAQLRAEGRQVDYLVVTQFADLFNQKLEKPEYEDVAERLKNPKITVVMVEKIVLRFSNRLSWAATE